MHVIFIQNGHSISFVDDISVRRAFFVFFTFMLNNKSASVLVKKPGNESNYSSQVRQN